MLGGRREAGTAPAHSRRRKPKPSEINEFLYGQSNHQQSRTDESVLDRLVAGRAPPRRFKHEQDPPSRRWSRQRHTRRDQAAIGSREKDLDRRRKDAYFPDHRSNGRKPRESESVFDRLAAGRGPPRQKKTSSRYVARKEYNRREGSTSTTTLLPSPDDQQGSKDGGKPLSRSHSSSFDSMRQSRPMSRSSKRNVSIDVSLLNKEMGEIDFGSPMASPTPIDLENMVKKDTPFARPPKASPSSLTSPMGMSTSPFGTDSGRNSPYLKYTRPPSRRRVRGEKSDTEGHALHGISSANHRPKAKEGWGSGDTQITESTNIFDVQKKKRSQTGIPRKQYTGESAAAPVSSFSLKSKDSPKKNAGSGAGAGKKSTTSSLALGMTSGDIIPSPIKEIKPSPEPKLDVPLPRTEVYAGKKGGNKDHGNGATQRPLSRRSRQRPVSSGKRDYLRKSNANSSPLFDLAYDLAGISSKTKGPRKKGGKDGAKGRKARHDSNVREDEEKFVAPPTAWGWASSK